MTRIALIQPPHSYDAAFNCLPTFQLGIGLLAVKDYLKQHGHDVRVFHMPWAQLEGSTIEAALAQIEDFEPRVAGVALNWLHFSEGAVQTAQKLKEVAPHCKVVIGGQHASLFHEAIIQSYGHVDAVVRGEAERSLLEVARRVEGNEPIDSTIAGLSVLRADGSFDTSPPAPVADLDSLPFFFDDDVWPAFPTRFLGAPAIIEGYLREFKQRAALDTVRGACPRDCSYCIASHIGAVQGRDELAAHSPEWLVEHMDQLVQRGVNSFTIQDPFFILGDQHLVDLCEAILRRGLEKKMQAFSIFVEPGAYSPEAMSHLARVAPAVLIEFGIETGSPKVAGAMGRETDYQRILENLTAAREAGLIPLSWWMVGLPAEGVQEIAETKAFIVSTMKAGVIPAQVSPMVLFPQTRLAQQCRDHGITMKLRSFEDFARFSREPLNDRGLYPNLISHSSAVQSAAATIRYAGEIKALFQERWSLLDACYDSKIAGFLRRARELLRYRFY